MIQATELRIGNLLLDAVKIQIEVCALGKDVLMAKDSGTSRYEVVRGIPLTEEWLLRFGFTNYETQWWYYKQEEKFVLTYEEYLGEKNFFLSYEYEQAPIKYVHQLQNLYFALTGTELTLKSEQL